MFVHATGSAGLSVTLRRSLLENGPGMQLVANLGDLTLRRSRGNVDATAIAEIVAAVSLVLAVDAERMLRRMMERGSRPEVAIRVVADDPASEILTRLRDGVLVTLSDRMVDIEPEGLAASVSVGSE